MSENPLLPATYDILWSVGILVALALLVWALVGIAKSALDSNTKLVWVIIAFLLPLIGPICWLVIRPRKEDNRLS
ncbi:PLD nuclease N-terminal domain-containing protein [Brevibacterium spongiae]|uniref:PLD nuclease N-terminal domain-containing protein n=1 Tax=Brevibacterium spongiae TaxID=2909672 RepID=A0ABY5SRC2_9MICO|nr:PLD nuclease N-terminal domain-containing protein [Brevibacterium spongiae]UVI37088.1 PLD nuclease N-terminal domain-containing protein [Brevibacterium spongiae]